MVCGKKKDCPRGRNLRQIYTENNVDTTARPSFLVTMIFALFCILETHYNVLSFVSFLCCFCQIRGAQNFLGPRDVKHLNRGLTTRNTGFLGI
jgi:hypothetical protein